MNNLKIVCLGDSFTRGLGVKISENWVSRLNNCDFNLPDMNVSFINKGINGDTTSGMLARLTSDIVHDSPSYVIISGGINDFIVGSGLDIPKNNYMALVHQARANRITPIIGICPGFTPDSVRSDWRAFADFEDVLNKLQELRRWLYLFANTFRIPTIDFFKEFNDFKEEHCEKSFYLDGLHLTAEGHREISDIAYSKLSKLLSSHRTINQIHTHTIL